MEKNVRKNWGFRNSQASPDAFARPIDIYAIGFEEIIDLNAGNVVAGKQSSENQNHWGTKLQKMLDTLEPTLKESYVLVCTTQLVGVCIFVFVRLGLCEYIRGLSSASVKTGLHGTAGNKGAVAVRFQVSILLPYLPPRAIFLQFRVFFFVVLPPPPHFLFLAYFLLGHASDTTVPPLLTIHSLLLSNPPLPSLHLPMPPFSTCPTPSSHTLHLHFPLIDCTLVFLLSLLSLTFHSIHHFPLIYSIFILIVLSP